MWRILKWILIILAVMAAFGAIIDWKKKREAKKKTVKDYALAKEMMMAEKYSEAASAFKRLGNFQDSAALASACEQKRQEADYNKAVRLFEAEKYSEAASAFKRLSDFQDSAALADACEQKRQEADYNKAVRLFEDRKYSEAALLFRSLPTGYKNREDCLARIQKEEFMKKQKQEVKQEMLQIEKGREADYNKAVRLFEDRKYSEAALLFHSLPAGYKSREDYLARIQDEKYKLALENYEKGYYWEATGAFAALPKGYKKRDDYLEALYQKAIECYEDGSYRTAGEWLRDFPEGYKERDTYLRNVCEKDFGNDYCAKSPDYRHSWEISRNAVQEGSICVGLQKCKFCGKEKEFFYDPYGLGV